MSFLKNNYLIAAILICVAVLFCYFIDLTNFEYWFYSLRARTAWPSSALELDALLIAPYWLNYIITIAFSLFVLFVVTSLSPLKAMLILISLVIGFIVFCYLSFNLFGLVIAMAQPLSALVVLYYILLPYRLIMEVRKSYEKDVAMAELASKMAHDIRSPLSALNLIKDKISDNKQTYDLLDRIIRRISNIADDLLETNKLSSLAEDRIIDEDLKYLMAQKKIEFPEVAFKVQIQGPIRFNKNYIEFERLLSNLINNAVEAKVHSRHIVEFLAWSSEKELRIDIIDNGCGFPVEMKKSNFEKGQSIGKEKGNGLGLYMAQELLNSWGGELKVESREGAGAKLQLHCPI